ncbi:hypothetical protein Tco_1026530, partial [Tanacetum coccineum]
MAASAIAISFDSLDESEGSPPSRVILFVVETTLVATPTGLCGLVPYSCSDSDSPDEMSSPEHISPLPAISLFLCTDSSKAPDSSDRPPSQDPYVATVAHCRSGVTSRPLSSSEFPIAPVTTLPEIRRRSAILIRLGEAIPFGRPYRTYFNGPRKLLTVRKRVGPLPARRLASRHASPRSSDHHSSFSSSSSDSLPVHSSGLDALDQAHSGSSTRDLPPRLYPPTTSESSSGDSSKRPLHSSLHSARPSHKRYSYSSEASIKEDTEIDPIKTEVDIELGISDGYDVTDHVEIEPRDVRDDTEEKRLTPVLETQLRDGIVRSFEDMLIDLDDAVSNFYHHMSERVSIIERIDSLRLENLKVHAMLDIKRDRVNSLRLYMFLSQEEFCQ